MRRVSIALAAVLILAACGSSGPSGPHANDAAVKAALNRYFAATTPAKACATISAAFRQYVGDGDASQRTCTAKFTSKVGTLPNAGGGHHKPKVTKISYPETQAEVQVTSAEVVNNYFFVKQGKTWLLNSIGSIRVESPIAPSPSPTGSAPSAGSSGSG